VAQICFSSQVFMYKMLTGRYPARASALRLTHATLVMSAGMA
jgi:hypothetical protein